jgi:prepilin-type processing-associated H-X9-DG protein
MNWRGRLSWAVLAGLVAALAGVGGDAADEKEKLPPDLAVVPAEALGILSIRPADFWAGELGAGIRKKLGKDFGALTAESLEGMGVHFDRIERLTFVLIDPRNEPLALVKTLEPFERDKFVPARFKEATRETYKDRTLYVLGARRGGFCALSDTVFVLGAPDLIKQVLDGSEKKGELASALAVAARKHSATLAVDVAGVVKQIPGGIPEELAPWKPLLQARVGTVTLDAGGQSTLKARVTFANAEAARAAEKPARELRDLGVKFLPQALERLSREKEMAPVVELLKLAGKALEEAKLEQTGSELRGETRASTESAKVAPLVAEAVARMRAAAARAQTQNNLKQIGLALHNYHDVMGTFPPQAVFDKDGKAILSWRVLILPYIDENELYKEFKLNEPWDSPHNKKLLEKMPKAYTDPQRKGDKPYTTPYQAFVGEGAFFEGKNGIKITDITDGTSNTFMAVEAEVAVPWSKPDDLPFKAGVPLPKLGGTGEGFNALFADGSVRYFSKKTPEKKLRAYVTRNGGEVIND